MRAFRRAVATAFAIGMLAGAPAASALNNPQDDKNNPTAPGFGAGNKDELGGPAWENRNEHCSEHYAGIKGGGSENLPAQCQVTVPR